MTSRAPVKAGTGSASAILGQKCDSQFRSSIPTQPIEQTARVSPERFDPNELGYTEAVEMTADAWAEATAALSDLRDAIPEAGRMLQARARLSLDDADLYGEGGGP